MGELFASELERRVRVAERQPEAALEATIRNLDAMHLRGVLARGKRPHRAHHDAGGLEHDRDRLGRHAGQRDLHLQPLAALDDVDRRAVYVAEGLGHGFTALSATASLVYLCTTPYAPTREHTIDPLDADLSVDWGVESPVLSPRDAEAPSLAEVRAAGTLPSWEACLAWYEETGQQLPS